MRDRGHEVVTVGRSSGDTHCDIADDTQLAQLWEQAGQVDAVVYTTLDELSSEDLESSLRQKALAQINLVRTGLEHVSTTGSFTLISGIPLHDPVVSGTAAAAANGVIKAFVRAAAVEIAPPQAYQRGEPVGRRGVAGCLRRLLPRLRTGAGGRGGWRLPEGHRGRGHRAHDRAAVTRS